MVDAGGPGSVRKCPRVASAALGDVEGFDRSGVEDQLYAFQLSDGVYKRKKFPPPPLRLSSLRSFLETGPTTSSMYYLAQVATKTRKSRGWNSCHRSENTSGAVHALRYSA